MSPEEVADLLERARRLQEELGRRGEGNGEAGEPIVPFPFWRVADMRALKAPRCVVEGLIPDQALTLIFAPSGHYKTMTAVDLVLSIAYRSDFHGLEVESMPIVYVANEDAYGLARQRVVGWLDFHGCEGERVVVIPGDVLLNDPDTPARILATARDAFPNDKRFGVVLDTWDKSIGGDPDKTSEVVPAVHAMEAMLKAGAAFVLTLSHTPWSNTDRSKGSVTAWASYAARAKSERDEASGIGTLTVVHMKNGISGLQLKFEYERHTFEVAGEATTTLIPRRIMDAPDKAAPKREEKPKRRLGDNEKIALDAFHAALSDHGEVIPPTHDIPRGTRGIRHDTWEAAALRYLPQPEEWRKRQKFGVAMLSLTRRFLVRHADGWYWAGQQATRDHP
jgi:hypothetical protein